MTLGPKCTNFGCWSYTNHRSGLCPKCRGVKTLAHKPEAPPFVMFCRELTREEAMERFPDAH